jgi:hypothetical protein
MFKYYKKLLPPTFDRYFISLASVHNYNTRASDKNFFIPRKNKNKGLSSLSFLGAKRWRKIPTNIKDKLTLWSFTATYKNELLNTYLE